MSHKTMIKGLENLGFSNSACWLQNCDQHTKLNNFHSDSSLSQQGVALGPIFGLLSFLLYTKDVLDILDINSTLYADGHYTK